jgi:hypothetical protein
MAIKASIVKGKLVIEADIEAGAPSKSGKTLVIASTRGNMKTDVLVGGKVLTIGLNAYVPVGAAPTPAV